MSSSRGPIILEKLGNVARVTLNRPEKKNAINFELQAALRAVFDELRNDDSIRVVMTTGAGDDAYCAGMDVRELLHRHDHPGGAQPPSISPFVRDYPKVTMAVVNGYALGAGFSLVDGHDLAVASEEKAKFGLPEIMRGFVPKVAIAPLFRNTSIKWAMEMLLTGENWDARRAYQAGLVNKVVPHADLQKTALDWARRIAQWDPVTVKYCKKAGYASLDASTYAQAVEVVALWQGEEARLNPRSSQGLREFVGGKGIKADK